MAQIAATTASSLLIFDISAFQFSWSIAVER